MRLRKWGFGASAALVAVFLLIIILNFGPSLRSSGIHNIIKTYQNEINATSIEDINLAYYSPEWLNIDRAGLFMRK